MPVHINSAEGFNDRIRRTISGVFHHISPHLADLYFDEIGFRWSQRVVTGQAPRRTRKGRPVTKTLWARIPPALQLPAVFSSAIGREMRRTKAGGIDIVTKGAAFDGSSNRGALRKLFLNSSPARAHDLSRGSLADNPDRGQSFGKPFARMPGQGRLRGRHQPPHDGLSQAGCSNVDDALRSSMRRCTPSGGIILPTSRQGRLRASRLDANGGRKDQVQQEG
jgi:ISXO2-like transposase domain